MLLTSGYSFEGYEIVSYIGHESAHVVMGTGVFSSFNASLSDLFGTRSNEYEKKLASAEKIAKEKLMEKAENRDGNAIIGIDVGYETFTSDIIGLIVSGTIVKIEKKKMSTKEIKRFPNMEYNSIVPFRILDIILMYRPISDEIFISLYGKNYQNDLIEGLEVKFKFETIFNDEIEVQSSVFTEIQTNEENEFFTEDNKLKLEGAVFKTIKTASVQIVKYVTKNQETQNVSAIENKKIESAPEQLMAIRKFYGNDSVGKAYKNEFDWLCFCGTENKNTESICRYCGRKINFQALIAEEDFNSSDIFNLYEHMDALNTLKDAKEIYEYLIELNCTDQYFNDKLLPEIKEYIVRERVYGNMKEAAIKKSKKYILKIK